jgi:hypothetical protein
MRERESVRGLRVGSVRLPSSVMEVGLSSVSVELN